MGRLPAQPTAITTHLDRRIVSRGQRAHPRLSPALPPAPLRTVTGSPPAPGDKGIPNPLLRVGQQLTHLRAVPYTSPSLRTEREARSVAIHGSAFIVGGLSQRITLQVEGNRQGVCALCQRHTSPAAGIDCHAPATPVLAMTEVACRLQALAMTEAPGQA